MSVFLASSDIPLQKKERDKLTWFETSLTAITAKILLDSKMRKCLRGF